LLSKGYPPSKGKTVVRDKVLTLTNLAVGIALWLATALVAARDPVPPGRFRLRKLYRLRIVQAVERATGSHRLPRAVGWLPPIDRTAAEAVLGLSPELTEKAGFRLLGRAQARAWRSGPGRVEFHQSFWGYVLTWKPMAARRNVLVMRAVDRWPIGYHIHRSVLKRFMSIFFQRTARWGTDLRGPLPGRLRTAGNRTWDQLAVRPILKALLKRVPDNAVAVLGVACKDLYPDQSWNFVFGQATLSNRVGVFSLARLFPTFHGEPSAPAREHRGLLRAMKVLSHETGHMLGLKHCVAFQCGMNGSNGMWEMDRQPLHFCPICLSKLAYRLDLDIERRYEELARFFEELGYPEQARRYRKLLELRRSPDQPPSLL
jgi:archaemetzincin